MASWSTPLLSLLFTLLALSQTWVYNLSQQLVETRQALQASELTLNRRTAELAAATAEQVAVKAKTQQLEGENLMFMNKLNDNR